MPEPEKYFSIPRDGTTISLDGGPAVADFVKGVFQTGNNKHEMGAALKPGEHIYTLHIRESGGQIVYVWPEGSERKIAIQAYDERDLILPPFTKLYLERAASGAAVEIQASTDINAYFFSNYSIIKRLNDIKDGSSGTFDTSTDSLEDIRDAVDTIDGLLDGNRLFGIYGPRAPPISEPLGNACFVDASVSASGAGTTWDTAVQTIQEAVDLCSDDDVIFIAAGDYDENATATGVHLDGTVEGIHIIGLGPSGVTVDNSHASATAVITLDNGAHRTEITGLTIDEVTSTVEGIYTNAADYIWIHHNLFRNTMENGVHLNATWLSLVENNWFNNMTNDAIELSGANLYNTIRGNIIWGAGDTGINLNGDNVDDNFIIDNNIHGAGDTTTGIAITLGDYNLVSGGFVIGCGNAFLDTGSNNRFDLPQLKPEWGTPVTGTTTPPGVGVWATMISLTLNNPGILVFEVDIDSCGVGESGVVTIEKKVDGSNWKVIHNLNYDDVDINTIDDIATTADATAPKRSHQWKVYVDSGTDVRARVNQAVGAHIVHHNYNFLQEVQQ